MRELGVSCQKQAMQAEQMSGEVEELASGNAEVKAMDRVIFPNSR